MKLNKIIILITIFCIFCYVFIYNIKHKEYQYITITECTLPIKNTLVMNDKNASTGRYQFISKEKDIFSDYRLDPRISVFIPSDNQVLERFKKTFNKESYVRLSKVINGIKVQYYKEKIINNDFILVLLQKSIINITNYDRSEVEYMVEYCSKHPHLKED